jgi:NitT/TauT family transport system permease protein
VRVGQEWEGTLRPAVEIDLSPLALPWYTFFSVVRGFAAYGLSLAFTLAFGYLAVSNRRAEKIMLPLLDILQSIPVLGFLPGLVLALVAIFPHSNTGLELAAVLMIFTEQVWNATLVRWGRYGGLFGYNAKDNMISLRQERLTSGT